MNKIKKTKAGTFTTRVYLGLRPDGTQDFAHVTRSTEKECLKDALRLESDAKEGKISNYGEVKFSIWVDRWMAANKGRLSPSTYYNYRGYVSGHYKPYFGEKKLGKITLIDIQEFMAGKIKDKLSVTTVRKLVWVLHRVLDDALGERNPAKGIKMPETQDFKPHVITPGEFEQIWSAAKSTAPRDEIIILLAAWCGLRRGEIFALKWDDFDWENDYVRIDESRCISEGGYVDKKTKSRAGMRRVAAPRYLMDLLSAYRKDEKSLGGYVFPGKPAAFSNHWVWLKNYHKLPDIRFHDLRHYHASWLYAQGIPDLYAAERMGHDPHVLKRIYQHLGLDKKGELDTFIKDGLQRIK